MAYFTTRPSGAVQIRESIRTPNGPRSRVLATFTGPLTDEVLDLAKQNATKPLNTQDLIAKARATGIGWEETANQAAREVVKRLRRGQSLEPALVTLMKEALASMESLDLADELEDAADWLATSDAERGMTLKSLLRLGDAIERSRDSARQRVAPSYPQIDSKDASTAW
jgi:hypothetical protein